jgi:hypothetical protein
MGIIGNDRLNSIEKICKKSKSNNIKQQTLLSKNKKISNVYLISTHMMQHIQPIRNAI